MLADGARKAQRDRRPHRGQGQGHRRLPAIVNARDQHAAVCTWRTASLYCWSNATRGSMRHGKETAHLRAGTRPQAAGDRRRVAGGGGRALLRRRPRPARRRAASCCSTSSSPTTSSGRACARSSSRSRPTRPSAVFRLFRRKLNNEGFEAVPTEEVIREGKKLEEILKQIDEDEDVAVLVLGASKEAAGPGPLVSVARRRRHGRQVPDPHHHRARRPGRRGHQGAGLSWPEGWRAETQSGTRLLTCRRPIY